jgi:hypothetical protein
VVTFQDRSDTSRAPAVVINEDFEVPGECMTRETHPETSTEIVLAYRREPTYGFYNRGLTLLYTSDTHAALEARAARFGHIALKIKSGYLEHTLSRETILKDRHYDQAVAFLVGAADGPLLQALVGELGRLASLERPDPADLERYFLLLGFLHDEPAQSLFASSKKPILRSLEAGPLSLHDVHDAVRHDGRIFITSQPTQVTRMLADQEIPVLYGRMPDVRHGARSEHDPGAGTVRALVLGYLVAREKHGLLGWISKRIGFNLRADAFKPEQWIIVDPAELYAPMFADPHQVYLAVELDDEPPADVRDFVRAAGELLKRIDAGYAELTSCVLRVPELAPPLFLVGKKLSALMARPPRHAGSRKRPRRPAAAVNRDHPQFLALLDVFRRRPKLGAYALAKNLLLAEDRMLDADARLMAQAEELGV